MKTEATTTATRAKDQHGESAPQNLDRGIGRRAPPGSCDSWSGEYTADRDQEQEQGGEPSRVRCGDPRADLARWPSLLALSEVGQHSA